MAPSDQLQYQITTLRDLVGKIRPEQMSNPTPCANWDVRGLCNHFVGGAYMFAAAFRGEPVAMDEPATDLVGDDPLKSFDAAIAAFESAIDAPGAMDKIIPLPFGDIPAPIVLEILKFDLLVHAWDISQATGQSFDPPAEIAEQGLETAKMIIAPEARDGDTFGAEVTLDASASSLDRLVAFTGRQVVG